MILSATLLAQTQPQRSQAFHLSAIDSLTAMEYYQLVQQLNGQPGKLQARNMKTHQLDSIYQYDSSNGNQPLELKWKEVIEYNDTLQVVKFYLSPTIDGKWTPSSFFKYNFYSKNGILQRFSYQPSWKGTSIEIDTAQAPLTEFFSYNDNDLLDTIEVRSLYPHGLNTISQLHIHSYDSLEQLTKVLIYSRHIGADTMFLYHETEYQHNVDGQLEYIVEYAEFRDFPWTAVDSIHYTYDTNGYLVKSEEYEGRVVDLEIANYIYEFINYPSGAPDTVEIRRYRNDSTRLVSRFLEVYEEQASGDPGHMRADYWRDSLYYGTGYGYSLENDQEISVDQVLFPPRNFIYKIKQMDEWNNIILSEETYNNYWDVQRPIEHFDRPFARQYFYSEIKPSSVSDQHETTEAVTVVPNPSNEQIQFVTHGQVYSMQFQLRLYSAAGELQSIGRYTFGEKYSIANLGPGVYFFQLERNQEVLSGRFVKL